MSGEIAPELVERMVALVHDLADGKIRTCDYGATRHRAQQIAAELPKPVDPDLIEARKVVADNWWPASYPDFNDHREATLRGERDTQGPVENTLRGIKRGRELATQSPATGRAAG